MNFHGFEIESDYLSGDTIMWHSAGLGEFAVGKKDGVRWFIKRNTEYRFPTEEEQPDKEMRDYYLVPAREYQQEREKLRKLMVDKGGLSAERDHIVAEVEHFIDESRLVIVSRYVENLARDIKFTGMEGAAYAAFCRDVALLLVKLHACGVIHGDLKVGHVDDVMGGNVVAAVEDGKLTPYLIDFDLSFPAPPAANPPSIPYSDHYESPEIVPYITDEKDEQREITTATDIFTLGIVFHKLWTGDFPAVEVGSSVGECVFAGGKVTINRKFDFKIGDRCGATFLSLINWMFAKDPVERPTAEQVAAVLGDEIPVPERFHKGADEKLFTGLWDAHTRIAELLPEAELRAKGITSFKRVNEGGRTKYSIVTGGSEACITLEELIAAGYARRKPAEVSEPWEEQNIEFVSQEEIAAKGYVEIKRVEIGGHRYAITTASGVIFSHGYEWLLSEGLARRKAVAPIEGDEPWPGDGRYASDEDLARRGVKKILRSKYGEENRYRVEYTDREPLDYVKVGTMKKLGYIV